MIIRGNKTPAIGIHVIPKQISKYAVWNSVNKAIALNGTVSTKVAWYSSRTLQKRRKSISSNWLAKIEAVK